MNDMTSQTNVYLRKGVAGAQASKYISFKNLHDSFDMLSLAFSMALGMPRP